MITSTRRALLGRSSILTRKVVYILLIHLSNIFLNEFLYFQQNDGGVNKSIANDNNLPDVNEDVSTLMKRLRLSHSNNIILYILMLILSGINWMR